MGACMFIFFGIVAEPLYCTVCRFKTALDASPAPSHSYPQSLMGGGSHFCLRVRTSHGSESINNFALMEPTLTDSCLTRHMPSSRSTSHPPNELVMRQFFSHALLKPGVPCKIERDRDMRSSRDSISDTSTARLPPCHDGHSSEHIPEMPRAHMVT